MENDAFEGEDCSLFVPNPVTPCADPDQDEINSTIQGCVEALIKDPTKQYEMIEMGNWFVIATRGPHKIDPPYYEVKVAKTKAHGYTDDRVLYWEKE